jgi:nucleoside-diphosphate-sugar epimerase
VNQALVAGAGGLIGRAIAERLRREGWRVVGLGRSAAAQGDERVDLLDARAVEQLVLRHADATHLFYAAYAPRPTRAEEVAPNRAMFVHLLDALHRHAAGLRRVVLVTGTKYYGVHLGPIRTPARETDPRHLPPNFYFDQFDALRQVRPGRSWTWTHLVLPFVTGAAVGHPMNLVMALAAYALVSREHGLPLGFPGSPGAWRNLFHVADASQIAEAALWSCGEPAAADATFNVANGDPTRWNQLWPAIAGWFGMAVDEPKPIPLAEVMRAQADTWEGLRLRHGLQGPAYEALVDWTWAEYMLRIDHEVLVAQHRLRSAGFTRYPDTAELLLGRFDELAAAGVIPPRA